MAQVLSLSNWEKKNLKLLNKLKVCRDKKKKYGFLCNKRFKTVCCTFNCSKTFWHSAPLNPVVVGDPVCAGDPDEDEVTVGAADESGGGTAKRSSIDTTNRSKPFPVFVTNENPEVGMVGANKPTRNRISKYTRFILNRDCWKPTILNINTNRIGSSAVIQKLKSLLRLYTTCQ